MSIKRLLIISDTKIQKRGDHIFGFPSVVKELSVFFQLSKQIHWIVVDDSGSKINDSFLLIPSNVNLHLIPNLSFKDSRSILRLFIDIVKVISTILFLIPHFDLIHVRGPNPVTLLSLLISRFHKGKLWWFKYANNWIDTFHRPLWRFQKYLMRNSPYSVVSVNGFWPNEPRHIFGLENPCITKMQLEIGHSINKDFNGLFKLVFVGRLESAKGIDILLESIPNLPLNKIAEWVFIGDGPLREDLKEIFYRVRIPVRFMGFVNQDQVHDELKSAHFLVLPSKSEGFPKVVAEAWNYGCIPIVSSIGCIPHYVKHGENGFLVEMLSANVLTFVISEALSVNSTDLKCISSRGSIISHRFTYDHYSKRLKEIMLNGN